MKETLLDLWGGKIAPWSDFVTKCEKEKHLYELVERNRDKLKAMLDDKGLVMLEAFDDRYGELQCFLCEEAFVKGFSLGVKLLTEAFMN